MAWEWESQPENRLDQLAVLRQAISPTSFIEEGELALALADLGLEPAEAAWCCTEADAFHPAALAAMISHLEASASELDAEYVSRKYRLGFVRPIQLYNIAGKRRLLLCFIAVCYRYLGQPQRARRALRAEARLADDVAEFPAQNLVLGTIMVLTWLVNPLVYWDCIREGPEGRYPFHCSESYRLFTSAMAEWLQNADELSVAREAGSRGKPQVA